MQPLYVPENAVPPQGVRFEKLEVEPQPNTRRVRVHVQITPFTSPPNLRVSILDPNSLVASSVHIVETIHHRMTFTMHIRSAPLSDQYTLKAEIYYPDIDPVDRRALQFSLSADSNDESD